MHMCLKSHPTVMICKLKYLKGENKVYEVYEKPQQADYFNKLFKSQLIYNNLNIQDCNKDNMIDVFIYRKNCI
jgi:hypothetical protein